MFEHSLVVNPDNAAMHNSLGVALSLQGDFEEAIHHYEEVLRLDPDYAVVNNNLHSLHHKYGRALAEQGKIDDAIRHFREALRIQPESARAHNSLGAALSSQGKYAEAIDHYNEALRIEPDHESARANLKNAYARQMLTKETGASIGEPPRGIRENPALYYQAGEMYRTNQELDRAIEQYEKALSIQPEYAAAMNGLALAHGIKGEYDRALALLMKILEMYPDSPIPYYNIACIQSRQSKVEESTDWLEKAVEKGFNDWKLLTTDEDLDNIRDSAYYKELVSGVSKEE